MTIATLLEDFAKVAAEIPTSVQKPEDLIGYSLGYDAGISDAGAENAQALRDLTSAIEELSFGYQEALQSLKIALKPLFRTLAERIVPECLDASLQTLVLQAIESAADEDMESPIIVRAHPDNVASLQSAAQTVLAMPISVMPDDNLSLTEVCFATSKMETSIDSALLRSSLVNALSAFHETDMRGAVNDG